MTGLRTIQELLILQRNRFCEKVKGLCKRLYGQGDSLAATKQKS